jgi:hypothetical protein
MILNLCLFIVLELATGFTNNLPQMLGVRALYGLAMVRRSSCFCEKDKKLTSRRVAYLHLRRPQ